MRGFRSGVEADGPWHHEGDRYYGPEGGPSEAGVRVLRSSGRAGQGLLEPVVGRKGAAVGRLRGEKWFSLTLCLSGHKGARWKLTRCVAAGRLADGSTRMWDRMSLSALSECPPVFLPFSALPAAFLVCFSLSHSRS